MPRYDDSLSRHHFSYRNGGGGSGKTTRAIEFFRQRDPLVFTPTHRLAKEMRARGVKAQTSHSFSVEWSDTVDARKDGADLHSPCDYLGRGLDDAPPHPGNLSWLDRGVGASRSSAVAIRGSPPQSPEKCHMTGSASGVCQQTATLKRSRLTTEPRTPSSRPSKTSSTTV